MAQRRCNECRAWFTPKPTATGHQRVCGLECRRLRRLKLARGRRLKDIDEQRIDERVRQRKHRDAAKRGDCHEPASDAKIAELLEKWLQILDIAARLSRATFQRAALQILRRSAAFPGAGLDRAGRCHEPPSAPEARENGSETPAELDSVTSRDGP